MSDLIVSIRLIAEEGQLQIQVLGELGAIRRLADGAGGAQNGKRAGVVGETLVERIKLDARMRSRRCQYIDLSI